MLIPAGSSLFLGELGPRFLFNGCVVFRCIDGCNNQFSNSRHLCCFQLLKKNSAPDNLLYITYFANARIFLKINIVQL